MLLAYWDESGDVHDPSVRFVCVAGLVAAADRWPAFDREWQWLLKEFGIAHFHMREFTAWRGEFKNRVEWPEERRRELLSRLLDAIEGTRPRLRGAVMVLSDWRMLTDVQRSWFVDPYFPCATECVRLASARAMIECETVQHCFARAPALDGKAIKLWEAQAEDDTLASQFIDCIETREMASCPALQAADLWAYETHKAAQTLAKGMTDLRYPMTRLLNMDSSVYVRYFDANAMRAQCDSVQRYLDAGRTR